ncbi:SPOR domain-containing protein [Mangrovibacterium diazotrophicum]|uniref:Sporulation related protein n=1 Tax=Mangrovibacterium diazotrophicum TaxID=1261403 RepID=A0A419VVD6_9BACT|nr:SPOR domain-containing protein [Mangrovibacterium diazotrophicum]RKD86095.1 sporulation related protein [Mangrovibacterium diazotrophicum]
MKLPIVGIIFLLFHLSVSAQEMTYKPAATSGGATILNRIDVQQDSRIDTLLNNHIEMNKKKGGTDGFRLEIFFSSGTSARQEAMKVRTDFLRIFPDVPAYMSFQSPNFKIRIGDCRTKSEALRLKEKIKKNYPNAFIVPDLIQFPKLYTADSN